MGESSTLSERATVRAEWSFADRWLLERYFWFAASILVWSLPLALMWRRTDDVRGLGAYVALTIVAWLGARANRRWAVRGHLFALFPYWAWYASLPEGTPHLLAGGGAGFAVMLVFPLLVLIALDGALAGSVAFLIGALGSSFAYEKMTDRLVGVFVLGVGFLVGLVFRRLVKELEAARLDLTQRSTRDPLTGLLNRAAFGERKTEEPRGALLFIDLDRFKTVNDVFGHAAGDQLLRMAAQRIVEAVPAEAVVYRLGGDEFAVVAPSRSADDGVRIASTVVASIEAPFEVGGGFVHVGATVGIALWPQHGAFMTKLLGVADNAMFKAKKTSRRILVQDSSEGDSLAVRALEVELRQAIKQKQLVPHLQAVVDLRTDRVVGAEVLVRWAHPERGLIAPAAFIDLAEETGQIVEIDRFVLGFAAQYVAELAAKGQDIWLAVNASARTLDDEDFLKDLEAIAQKNLARKLVIEITESATMRDPERSVSVLQRMCKWGFQVAIDDFGMGYSSLAYLRKLPASHLKIDRTFTAGIGRYPRDEDVVELVLQLAKKFELEVVAEGVETNEQRVWLRERGCRFVQGFGIARPCPVDQFVLESRNSGVGLVEPSSGDFSLVDSGEIPAASGRKLRRVPT